MESYKKFNEKAQTANFSDLTRQRQELCAENAKNTKTRETKMQITQKGWPPIAKLKKIQDGIVRFGCNFGDFIAYLCRL